MLQDAPGVDLAHVHSHYVLLMLSQYAMLRKQGTADMMLCESLFQSSLQHWRTYGVTCARALLQVSWGLSIMLQLAHCSSSSASCVSKQAAYCLGPFLVGALA